MKRRGIRLDYNQIAEIKDPSGRVLLRVRIVPGSDEDDGPTVQIGRVSGWAGFDWSDSMCHQFADLLGDGQ